MTSNTFNVMLRTAAVLATALALTLFSGSAHADLAKGRELFVRGEYQTAIRELKSTSGSDEAEAQIELTRVYERVGKYEEAEAITRKLAKNKDPAIAIDASIVLSRILGLTGRYADARTVLEPLAQQHPDHLGLRHQLARAYVDLGLMSEASLLWNQFFDDYDNQKIDLNNAEHMYYVAQAAEHIDSFEDASGSYRDAVDIDANAHRANIEWGYLFLRKYAPGDAEQSFDEVLKLDPHHPDAHAGIAAVKLSSSYDVAAAEHAIRQALAVNPRHTRALLVRASLEIDKNEWKRARATLDQIFKTNPESFHARAMLATIHWLREDVPSYELEKKRVFDINPAFAEFFHIVMRSAEREHRYDKAIELGKEAVRINPRDFEAMQEIGTGYLRLGKEKEGIDWLRKAWRGDQFNVRTDNTLELFEKHIPRQYEFTASKNFRIRYHKEERPVLERYVTPLLERAFEDMVKRYGFRPSLPIVIELYKDPDHYSVRTVGLPNLGALGVCFGQVITAMSPTVGDLNWSMVLWHELSHVFAIQLSDSRVPRWFTEGLSEYETIRARPEWRRENDSDLWNAMQDGTLPSVAELNYGFMEPDMQRVVVAYHLSSVTIEYLVAEYGFDKIVVALKLFGQGKETPEVIEAITGKKIAVFDAEFRAHLQRRLAPYRGSLHIPATGLGDVKKLEAAAKKKPKDAQTLARLALGYFYDGDADKAGKQADAALAIDKGNAIGLYIQAELALKNRKMDEATQGYEQLIRQGHDSFDVRARLAMIAARNKDNERAEKHLCTAKKLDPERSYPYQMLSEMYFAAGKTEKALEELETYVAIEQMQFAPIRKLVDEYSKLGKWHKVVTYGERGVDILPSDGALQLALGQAYLETKRPKDALFSFDSALLVHPPLRRPAQAHLGRARALRALGKKSDALAALKRALELEPDNAEALELQKASK